tara:strand:+ start:89890 stop:90681 length:792 start_codon:yes stop_codon:yes gene_type:complete
MYLVETLTYLNANNLRVVIINKGPKSSKNFLEDVMTKTAGHTSQPEKTSQVVAKPSTSKSPSTTAQDMPLNVWSGDPERIFSNFYQAWRDMTRSLLPTLPELDGNGGTVQPTGDTFGLTAWQEQADRYFKDFNQKWLNVAKVSTFNVFAPINPMAMGAGVTINDNDGKYTVSAPLPGLDEDEVDVQLDEGFLVISGKNTESSDEKDNGARMQFWQSGNFRYLVRLPADVVTEKIKADFSKGVLTVTMPKTTPNPETTARDQGE